MPGLMFPKTGSTKKKRRSHPDSILQKKEEGYCYLCAMLKNDWRACRREEHHIFFSAHQRQLSEEYGLKVYLCSRHHREGKEAVHQNQKIRRMLEARLDMDENMGNLNDRITRQARATFHRPAFQGTILEPRGQQDNDSAITENGASE